MRAYRPVLDRPGDEEPISQTLIEGVEELEFFAIDQNGEEHKFWPPNQGQGEVNYKSQVWCCESPWLW